MLKKRTKRRWKNIMAVCAVIVTTVLAIIFARLGYDFSGTGFNSNIEMVKPGEQLQPAKTLWDWMQLLLVPTLLVIGAFTLNLTITRNEQKIARKRFKLEHKIAINTQQENLLHVYLDRITELLLHEDLRKSAIGAEVRNIARAQTITAISRLTGDLQRNLLHFLREAGLIKNGIESSIISLEGVEITKTVILSLNLKNSNLKGLDISKSTLLGPDFSNSNLDGASFYSCDLREGNFFKASVVHGYLSYCSLVNADLSEANLPEVRLAHSDLLKANLSMRPAFTPQRRELFMRLAQLIHSERGIVVRHRKRCIAHLALHIQRTAAHRQLSDSHITAALVQQKTWRCIMSETGD